MLALDSNPDDFKTGNEARVDEQLMVKFFIKERQDKDATATEGRPIFKEVEYVEIRIAGKRDAQACRPATHADKQRFHRHYSMFKDRIEAPVTGTPLSEWPAITRSQCEELSFISVKTVEQLANMADSNISNIQGGYTLKRRANEWLETAGESKLMAEKEALEARLADMEAKMDAMINPVVKAPAMKPIDPQTEPLSGGLDTAEPVEKAEKPKSRSRRRTTPAKDA